MNIYKVAIFKPYQLIERPSPFFKGETLRAIRAHGITYAIKETSSSGWVAYDAWGNSYALDTASSASTLEALLDIIAPVYGCDPAPVDDTYRPTTTALTHRCPVCDDSTFKQVFFERDRADGKLEVYDVWRCEVCQFTADTGHVDGYTRVAPEIGPAPAPVDAVQPAPVEEAPDVWVHEKTRINGTGHYRVVIDWQARTDEPMKEYRIEKTDSGKWWLIFERGTVNWFPFTTRGTKTLKAAVEAIVDTVTAQRTTPQKDTDK